MVTCNPISTDVDIYKEYLFLLNIDTNNLESAPRSYSIIHKDYIYNIIRTPDIIYVIIDFKTISDIKFDSIKIMADHNNEITFPKFANVVSLNEGRTLSHRSKLVFKDEINVIFKDASKIDTIYSTHNAHYFITGPTRYALSDENLAIQVILDNEHKPKNILNVIYKSNYSLYLIQIKSKLSNRDITYKDIYRLNLN